MNEEQDPKGSREISVCPCGRSHDTHQTLHILCALLETYSVVLMRTSRDEEGRDRALAMAKQAGMIEVASNSRVRGESIGFMAMGMESLLTMSIDPMAEGVIERARLHLIMRAVNDALLQEGTIAVKSLTLVNQILGKAMPDVQRLLNGGTETGVDPTKSFDGPPEIVTQIARAVAERFGNASKVEPVDTRFVEDFLARSGVNVKPDQSHGPAQAEPEEDPHPDEDEETGDPHVHIQMIDAEDVGRFFGIGLANDEDEPGESGA